MPDSDYDLDLDLLIISYKLIACFIPQLKNKTIGSKHPCGQIKSAFLYLKKITTRHWQASENKESEHFGTQKTSRWLLILKLECQCGCGTKWGYVQGRLDMWPQNLW